MCEVSKAEPKSGERIMAVCVMPILSQIPLASKALIVRVAYSVPDRDCLMRLLSFKMF